MATLKYSDFIDEVLPFLAADPSNPVTENAIKRAVIEFCAGSWIWKYLPDATSTVSGEAEYDLEPPAGADVSVVMHVALDGVQLTHKSLEWLDSELPRWRTTTGTPKYFSQVNSEQIVLAPAPDYGVTDGLSMTLALQPSQTATGFPSWIGNQYFEDLANGAISKLMLMPNKPWTDLKTGADRRNSFQAAIANARASAVRSLARAEIHSRSHH